VRGDGRETLSYYAFPGEHWCRIRTGNPLERLLCEVGERTRVVAAFPDGQSCIRASGSGVKEGIKKSKAAA